MTGLQDTDSQGAGRGTVPLTVVGTVPLAGPLAAVGTESAGPLWVGGTGCRAADCTALDSIQGSVGNCAVPECPC